MKYVLRVLPYLRPYWMLAVASAVVIVLMSLSTVLAPWPLTILVDNVLGSQQLPPVLAVPLGGLADDRGALLVFAVVAGLLVTLVSGGLDVLGHYLNTKLEQRIVLEFRSDLLEHTQRLSVAYADQVSTGRLMYAINFEAAAAGRVIMAMEPLARGALAIIGMAWVSYQIDPWLALLSLVVVPLLYYAIGYYARHIQPRLMRVKGMEADALSITHDAVSMLRVVAAFVRERHELQRYREQSQKAVAGRVDVTVRQTVFSLVVNMTTAIGTALVLGVGASHALQGQITTGQLLVVLSYVGAIYKPLQDISYTLGSLQDQIVGLQMGFHVFDTQPLITDAPGAKSLDRAKGRITFEGVSFSYPGRVDTLRAVSFEAQAGQVVAVVGPTGAGKTTLMSLIPRFYDPSLGRVLLDGVDIREITIASLRDQISLVPQEPILFAGTIADNVRYGRLDATMDEIIQAATAANAHDFITRLPDQYDTHVGERGVQLSGGERQRICVARAFVKDAPILILDEPTSSIDSRTEAVILDALDRLMLGRTTFVIAHRLSTVRNADLVLVLDRSELVEQGTPEELLQRGGMYRELYDAQFGRRADDAPGELLAASAPIQVRSDGAPGRVNGGPGLPDETAPAESPGRSAYAVDWLSYEIPEVMETGAEYRVTVTLRNAGDRTWHARPDEDGLANAVQLSYHWLHVEADESVIWDGRRTPLVDVAPGAQVTLDDVLVTAPDEPDTYRLQLTLVHEAVTWFEHQGAATMTIPVTVCAASREVDRSPVGLVRSMHSNGVPHGRRP